jgi:hypothetical protein
MLFVWTVICVIPSAWVNAEAQWRLGAGWSWIVAVIGFAVLASVFTTASIRSFQRWNVVAGTLWGTIAAIFITMNAIIALSGVSGIREAASDRRAFLQQQDASRKDLEKRLVELRALAKDASTPDMIRAEMRRLKGKRWDQANERLATARSIAELQSQLDGWSATTEPVPASTDPGIDNLIVLVVALFNVKLNERFMGALLSAAWALLLELGADLGPAAITSLTRRNLPQPAAKPAKTCQSESQQRIQPAANLPVIMECSDGLRHVRDWVSGRCETGLAGTTELAADYNRWANAHGEKAMTITAMGIALRNLGYSKEPSGKKRWIGLRPKSMKLEVVG